MSTRFIACDVCARHVREGDAACPFCGAGAPFVRPLRTVRRRLTRAALHAAGAAGAIAVFNDCNQDSATQTYYGSPCIEADACVVLVGDAGQDAGGAEPIYGAPCIDGSCVVPQPEAGPDAADASTPVDASSSGPGDAADGG